MSEDSDIETNLEQMPLRSHSVEYVYEAVLRSLNLHPEDFRSARAAMRFILAQHEEAMLAVDCPAYQKTAQGEE